MPLFRKVLVPLLFCAMAATACEADQEGGVCFLRWTDGQGGVSQHCDATLGSAGACDALAESTAPAGSEVTHVEWMPECADARCTGTCHPDWYVVYGAGG